MLVVLTRHKERQHGTRGPDVLQSACQWAQVGARLCDEVRAHEVAQLVQDAARLHVVLEAAVRGDGALRVGGDELPEDLEPALRAENLQPHGPCCVPIKYSTHALSAPARR